MTDFTAPFEPIIGLEVHAQIKSESKMFCDCSARYFGAPPNTHVCAVCGGFPGALPVINRRGIEATVMTGLALRCEIARRFKFDRKNYSYPDLPKGYQITQYDNPIASAGVLEFASGGSTCTCRITRVHLEEDTGKSTHVGGGQDRSLIDYNRSGVPLMEIVSEPDLRSAEAARDYFATLREMLVYLDVSDGSLQEGSMRADVNVSVTMPDGSWGTKVEIKNLNSFRAVQRAIEFEVERQREEIEAGKTIDQETRGWSEELGKTLAQRSKEYAHDYRYFPEPDLPPVVLADSTIDSIAASLPELPGARRERLAREFGLEPELADLLTVDRTLGNFYEQVMSERASLDGRLTATWLTQEVRGLTNEMGVPLRETSLTPALLAELVALVQEGRITGKTGKELLPEILSSGVSPGEMVEQRGLAQVSDTGAIREWAETAVEANPKAVVDFLAGKEKALEVIVGRVMGASRGKANPDAVRAIVREILEERR